MKIKELKNLFIYNSVIFFLLFFFIELILGNWRNFNAPVTTIPAAPFSRKMKRNVSKIYNLEKPYYISNIRDKNGYRSSQDYSNKNIILTIGGSTTAQRFLDEKHTFQNVLSRKLDNKFAVLNGGVSGQSSLGHLFSIKNWHSKTLAVGKIKYIVYLF